MRIRLFISLLILIHVLCVLSAFANESYHERLILTPLDGDADSLLASLNFTITAAKLEEKQADKASSLFESSTFVYLPSLFIRMLDEERIEHFHLSLTQGFWRTNLWGEQPLYTEMPSGTQLLAKFIDNPNNESSAVDIRWERLIHRINGLFCTSILHMTPTMTSVPMIFVRDDTMYSASSNENNKTKEKWRFGVSSGESICSENLKTWRKLLPCKQNGLVSLLEPRTLLSSKFQSISVHIEKRRHSQRRGIFEWHVQLFSNTIFRVEGKEVKDLSLYHIFGTSFPPTKCVVAEESEIFLDRKRISLKQTEDGNFSLQIVKWNDNEYFVVNLLGWAEHEGIDFSINKHSSSEEQTPKNMEYLSMHTYAKEIGQISGVLTTKIDNRRSNFATVIYTQLVPWQIRVFLHTLRCVCRREGNESWSEVSFVEQRMTLARDMQRPLLIEVKMHIPMRSTCRIEFDYATAFLRITDYPADANSGIFVPGPMLIFNDTTTSIPATRRVYGEPVLILLPVPDFSMPFNVICLVCTLMAFFFGNALTSTTKLMKPILKKKEAEEKEISNANKKQLPLLTRIWAKFAEIFIILARRKKNKMPSAGKSKSD